jgi:hypothetical protein
MVPDAVPATPPGRDSGALPARTNRRLPVGVPEAVTVGVVAAPGRAWWQVVHKTPYVLTREGVSSNLAEAVTKEAWTSVPRHPPEGGPRVRARRR